MTRYKVVVGLEVTIEVTAPNKRQAAQLVTRPFAASRSTDPLTGVPLKLSATAHPLIYNAVIGSAVEQNSGEPVLVEEA